MQIFETMINIFDKKNDFVETKNSYFETHICNDKKIKVQLDYEIVSESKGDTIVFGKCPECNKVFYNVH